MSRHFFNLCENFFFCKDISIDILEIHCYYKGTIHIERVSYKMTMGERIRTLRKQHFMSMEELGSKIGVGKSAILKYEKGQVENLPRSTIEKMAILCPLPI